MHRHVPLYTFAASVERQFYMRPQTIFQEKEKCAATQRRHTNRRAAAERPSKKKKEDIRNVVMSLRAPVRPPPPRTRTESCMAPACHDGKRYGIARHDSTHHE